jgi:hypothetical protein
MTAKILRMRKNQTRLWMRTGCDILSDGDSEVILGSLSQKKGLDP